MSGYYAEIIFTGKSAYKWDVVRDFDGYQWGVLNAAGALVFYKSTDGGKNWTAIGTDPSGVDDYFDLIIDGNGTPCIGIKQWNGAGGPTVRWYDETNDVWSELATGFAFITNTNAVDCRFAVDTSRQPYLGINRFVVVYELVETGQWNIKYADVSNQSASGIRVNADVENQHNPKVAVSQNGYTYIAYMRATSRDVRVVQRLETQPATFSPSVLASVAHDVENLLDMRIQPGTDRPSVLYLRKDGSNYECWLSELESDGSWTQTQVEDGTNNPIFYDNRARLQYDELGSVYVTSVNDEAGGTPGTGRPYIWCMRRALGETTWTGYDLTPTGVGGTTTSPPAIMACRGTHQNGVFPISLRQGIICWPWVWPDGSAANDQVLYYANLDEYPGNTSYPTILSAVEGEPMYRPSIFEIDENDLDSIVLDDEGTAVTTYPNTPDAILDVSTDYEVHECNFIVGYVGTVPKFASARRVLKVRQNALDETDLETITDFLAARVDDVTPFHIQDGDGGTMDVFLYSENKDELVIEPVMVDIGVWQIEFLVLETL